MRSLIIALLSLLSISFSFAQKTVVIEKFTNSHCGVCPDVSIAIQEIVEEFPNAIWINHHKPFTDNPLNNAESLALWDDLNAPGVPLAMINRVEENGSILFQKNEIRDLVVTQSQESPNAEITIKAVKLEDRNLSFRVETAFNEIQDAPEYRITAFMVEDSVWGEPQDSYFDNTPGHPLEGLGDPIWAYPHKNVVRNILDDHWGTTGIIPANPETDLVYQHEFEYQIPEEFREDRMHIVCMISSFDSSDNSRLEIMAADKYILRNVGTTSVFDDKLDNETITLFPVPATDLLNMEFTSEPTTITILGLDGREIQRVQADGTKISMDISEFESGTYFVQYTIDRKSYAKIFSVSKY